MDPCVELDRTRGWAWWCKGVSFGQKVYAPTATRRPDTHVELGASCTPIVAPRRVLDLQHAALRRRPGLILHKADVVVAIYELVVLERPVIVHVRRRGRRGRGGYRHRQGRRRGQSVGRGDGRDV